MTLDFDNGLLAVECERCKGSGIDPIRRNERDPDWCEDCGGMALDYWDAQILVRNLRDAGALCAAFRASKDYWLAWDRMLVCDEELDEMYWHPGCRRNAPGWSTDERGGA